MKQAGVIIRINNIGRSNVANRDSRPFALQEEAWPQNLELAMGV